MACCPKDDGPGETLIKLALGLVLVVPAAALAVVAAPVVALFVLAGGRIDFARLLAWPLRRMQDLAQAVTAQRCRLSGRLYGTSPRLAGLVYRHFLLAGAAVMVLVVLATARLVLHFVGGVS